ncbi:MULTISPECIES: DUF6708 domain-containing protein [unclassified Pseudomonas]|uniref:DUF6708 domain-containing protein n=1 Tax=unclassified Pseudomonas TaxID=196821 RepID=UPI00380080C8
MSVIWTFEPKLTTPIKPNIAGQLLSASEKNLSLRNPWVTDSVLMGKLYTAMMLCTAIFFYPGIQASDLNSKLDGALTFFTIQLCTPFIFMPFLVYRVLLIKKLSNILLNRSTKKIYYRRFKQLIVFDWNRTVGGLLKRTEFGGSSFSTSYALAFAPRREDGTLHQKDCLWIDSNEPTEGDIKHVAEVWEYLRHFMDHGPDKLPPPGEPNWWYKPLHEICLTPAQAFQHYAPWRTGEPGEMQGKKNWQLPFWAVLFPYNLSVAIGWYIICRVFNVRAAPPPPEAFEEAPPTSGKRKQR